MPLALSADKFYGEPRQSRGIAGLLLTERVYTPHAYLPPHSHERAYFRFVCEGALTETQGQQTRVCRALSVILRPPEDVHSERIQQAGARNFIVQFAPAWHERVRDYSEVLQVPAAFDGGAVPQLAARLYQEFSWMDSVAPLAIEALVLEMVAEASRRELSVPGRSVPRWLSQVRDLIHARFAERLGLSSIAEAVDVHPVHLARTFRRHFRCSIGEYLRQCRIDYARGQLRIADRPLSEIALDAGFCDQGHFCRTFSRLTGMTPSEFRRKHHARS